MPSNLGPIWVQLAGSKKSLRDRERAVSTVKIQEIRAYLVLHVGNRGRGGKRSCVGKPVEQEFQTKEMVTVSMGDVNGCEILAALGDPI